MKMTRRQMVLGSAAAGAALVSAQAWGGSRAARAFEVTNVELVVPGLEATHDGLRVAQLSDLHVGIGTPDGRIVAALHAVESARVDLLVLTGDFISYRCDPVSRVGELLRHRSMPTFAVLGNHDHWTYPAALRKTLEHADITVLQNAHTVTQARGRPFTLFGIDDEYSDHADVAKTFRGAPRSGSGLVLAHTPVTADQLPENGGYLCLSGHTHGGQVYVPGFSERLFAAANSPYLRGRHAVQGNQLYVNRGIGLGRGSYGVRIASPAEVTIFTLRSPEEVARSADPPGVERV